MILGLTSFLSAGKGKISDYLKEKDFEIYSCSDIIREECKKRKIEITRDNLQKVGNELREEFGANILAKKLVEKIKLSNKKNFVVESIRSLGEIKELRNLKDFTLVFVNAEAKIRYERAKKRLREKEHVDSFEEFMASEKKEFKNDNKNSQQLLACKEESEFVVNNNKSIEDLRKEIDDLLIKLQIKYRHKPSWDDYFLNIAKEVSYRSSCLSAHIGCLITINNTILSTGYNGAPRGTKDCYEKGYCLRRKLNVPSGERYELCASVHAEQNAIINAAREGIKIKDGTMYLYGTKNYQGMTELINTFPCFICKKMIINVGIKRVVCSTKDGKYKEFLIKDWVEDWRKQDIVDDKEKFNINYK